MRESIKNAIDKLAHDLIDRNTIQRLGRTLLTVVLAMGFGFLLGVVLSNEDARTVLGDALELLERKDSAQTTVVARLDSVVTELQRPNSDSGLEVIYTPD
ncbi:MAG: hypothetical protein OXF01_07885 [Gemmatimonadetes bacterium]|nr:hypothetical protein [Gemmatimonadota bacterium]